MARAAEREDTSPSQVATLAVDGCLTDEIF